MSTGELQLSSATLTAIDDAAAARLHRDRSGLVEDLTTACRLLLAPDSPGLGAAAVDRGYWRARLGLWLARAHRLDDERRVRDELVAALSEIRPGQHPLLEAQLLAALAAWERRLGNRRGGVELLDEASNLAGLVPPSEARRLRVTLHSQLAVTVLDSGDADTALTLAAEVCDAAASLDASLREQLYATAVMIAGYAAVPLPGATAPAATARRRLLADVDRWALAADEAGTVARASGAPGHNRHLATYALARRAHLGGAALQVAADLALEAVRLADDCGVPDARDSARVLAAELLTAVGRHAEALDHLDAIGPAATADQARALYLRSTCLEALGDLRGAMASLREFVRRDLRSRDRHVQERGEIQLALLQRDAAARERDDALRQSEEAQRLARLDPLTGIANRLAFDEAFEAYAARQVAVVLALVDLDRFKSINDAWGHQVGDEVLRRVTSALREYVAASVGPGEHVFRIGGEELAILATVGRRDDDWVEAFADGARTAVEWIDLADVVPGMQVTTSIGVAAGTPRVGDAPGHDLAAQADHNLYKAKRRGRNRTVVS